MAHDTKAYHKERNRILSEFNKAHGTKHKTLAAAGLSLAKPKPEAVARETNLPVEVVAQVTPKRMRTRKTKAKQAKATRTRTRKPKVAEPTADLVLEDGAHADSREEREAMERGIAASEANEEALASED